MKTISLKSIEIKNFKGISDFSTTFSDRVEIYGRNGLGKTSILDAFLWCLFGKDSTGASSFSIKPLNEDGTIKDHHDVDVMCVLSIDGVEKSFRRKWVEKRSKKGDEFKGNEGVYFVNEAPMKEIEYSRIISEICREDLFKLITSTGAFNRMKDADKRAVLAGMSDTFTDEDIAVGMPHVLKALADGKTIAQFKDEIKSKRNRAELELEQYPTRLKENADSRPVVPEDIGTYAERITQLQAEMDYIEKKLQGSSSADHDMIDAKRKELQNLKELLFDIERQCRKEIDSKRGAVEREITNISSGIATLRSENDFDTRELDTLRTRLEAHQNTLSKIAQEWTDVNMSTVDATVDTVCPTCGKAFSEYDIDVRKNEIIRAFNEDKLKRLDAINERGATEQQYVRNIKERIEQLMNKIATAEENISTLLSKKKAKELELDKMPNLSAMLDANAEYQTVKRKHDTASSVLKVAQEPTDDDLSLMARRGEVQAEIANLRKELSKLDEIKRMDDRKAELEAKQKELGQLVAEYKMIDAEIQAFSMKKTSMIERSVSSKFKFVRFKMFEYNLSNDGVREVCVCTVNGVPYKDLNTAMQYNADIDIINALSAHYDIVAPVFIDRAESINKIEDTAGQRIDLYATKEDRTLRVEHTQS